jgi:dihydroorotate dehydrogenase electron transfer subunit
MSKKAVTEFTVIRNKALNGQQSVLVLQAESELLKVSPGQFVNIEIPGNKEVFLRRPFSVFDIDYFNQTITILVKVLGKGSLTLTRMVPGEKLNLIYPLGKGFTMPVQGEKVLGVGGGSGLAPILFLTGRMGLNPHHLNILLGARTALDHIPADENTSDANLFYTTEDGSMGEKGLVIHHSIFKELQQFDKIYACGPLPMMKAVAAIARQYQIFCEVSLENLMACGFGVCLCCVEQTVKGNLCVCAEGPVFNINDLTW